MSVIALLGGGLFLIYLFTAFWEVAVFKRVMDDPVKGKISSVFAAYLTASILSGLVGVNWDAAFLYYIFAAVIVGTFAYRRGMTLRQQPEDPEGLGETFK